MNIKNISKEYYTKEKNIIALDNISYDFEAGKFYAIKGHSGSGKSTLINVLGLIDGFTKGSYIINEIDVNKLNEDGKSDLRMKYFGFVFQDFYLDPNLKAYENVVLPMIINSNISKNERKEIAISLLKFFGLEDRCNHYPHQLSGGEQQRVCLARALANNPEVILADEPTGNLDRENEKKVFEYLKKLSKNGKCIIVVSHSEEINQYADIILNIENGKLVS